MVQLIRILTEQIIPPVIAERYATKSPKIIPIGKRMNVNNSFLLVKFILSSPNICAASIKVRNNMLMNPQILAVDKRTLVISIRVGLIFLSIKSEG